MSHVAPTGEPPLTPSTTRPVAETVLSGGGTMGSLMRAKNWADTPLGPIEEWPQSLRTTISTCLNSRFPILIWWGPDHVMLYNDAYEAIIGAKHPRALGAPGRTVFPEIWDIIGPMLGGVLASAEATWSEDQLLLLERHGYSEECYFTFSYSPIRDESGQVGGIFTAVTETTQRIIGERRLATLSALAERTASAHSPDDAAARAITVLADNPAYLPFALIYRLDPDGHAPRLAGAAHSTPAAERYAWPIDDAVTATQPLRMSLPASMTEAAGEAVVIPIARAGPERPFGVLVAAVSPRRPLDDAYAGFLNLVAGHIGTAIANAEAYEAERRRAEALAQIDRAKTAFFANVSHEFRTPLTLLLGPAEDMLDDPSLNGVNRQRIGIVHRNALRLHRLVNTLLDFSRLEAGRVEARYERVDLGAYSTELASSFRSAIERAGLGLVVDAQPIHAAVYVDRAMWEQIVLNLISNAFKHTFAGSISVSVSERGGFAELAVRDTGIGIPADQLSRLFERFHRVPTARARTHEGSGIGLALVQELVRLHGGEINVTSEEGEGSVFTVRIPTGTSHLPAACVVEGSATVGSTLGAAPFVEEALRWLPNDTSAEAPAPEPGEPHTARIVLADDNADMRDYVSRLLRDRGWTVEAVTNGQEALDAIERARPDLVISDIMMPRMDGFALLRAIRADANTAMVPVILLSARAGEESRIEGLERGADDYLVKPFSARELVARVHAHLGRAEVRSRLAHLVRRAPAFICVLRGPDHVFEMANDAYHQMMGFRPLVGRPVRDAVPEAKGQGFFELLDGVMQSREPFVGKEMPIKLQRVPGAPAEQRIVTFVYQPIIEPDGSCSGVFVHGVDVTDQVHARAEAESANRAKSDFLAAMSHELRTPLNAIAGYADLLMMGVQGPITDTQRHSLERIQRSEQHLLALINDVLNFAKIEAGRVEYDIEAMSLAEAVAVVTPMIEPQVASKSLRLEVAVDDAVRVLADAEKVQQILLNLLSNAIKFTGRGGVVRMESSEAVMDDGRRFVILRVRDTGIGIPRERQESIFDPFVQVHRNLTRSTEGTGLGLAISRDLAHGMGGDLTVSSAPGEGSVFTLRLPGE